MQRLGHSLAALAIALVLAGATAAFADPFFFSTGEPDGRMAAASRPKSHGKIEIEAADDFIVTSETHLDRASFTGLLRHGGPGEIRQVDVELYRVFPNDSNVARTSGPPTFSTPQVPTRVNSPADEAFDSRDSAEGTLGFTVTVLDHKFTAANSVIDGIQPVPDQATKGDGAVKGPGSPGRRRVRPAIRSRPWSLLLRSSGEAERQGRQLPLVVSAASAARIRRGFADVDSQCGSGSRLAARGH
jgi:hypothetical protein